MKKSIHTMSAYTQIFLVTVFVLMSLTAGALQAQERRSITLGEAIEIALENNIELKQFSNQVAVSELSVQQAKADFYPNLNASASVSEGYSRRVDPITDQTEGRDVQSLNARLSSSVTLFDGFSNVASLEKSKLDLAAKEQSFSRTHQSIMLETISRYLQVLQDKELLGSEQEHLNAQRRQLELIEEFYKVGNRSIADVLQQQATIAQAELRVLSAERNLNVSTLRLLETMGLGPAMDVKIVELSMEQLEQLTSDVVYGDPDQLVQKALAQRPDVEAQSRRIVAANEQVRVARAGYWPALSLSASGGSSYNRPNASGGFSDQFLDYNPNASIGLSLSIPLFDRSRAKHSVAQANIQLANERLTLVDLRQEVAFQVRQPYWIAKRLQSSLT